MAPSEEHRTRRPSRAVSIPRRTSLQNCSGRERIGAGPPTYHTALRAATYSTRTARHTNRESVHRLESPTSHAVRTTHQRRYQRNAAPQRNATQRGGTLRLSSSDPLYPSALDSITRIPFAVPRGAVQSQFCGLGYFRFSCPPDMTAEPIAGEGSRGRSETSRPVTGVTHVSQSQ